jgi:tetratricopeptide (TPR) repeat protein
MRFLPLIITFLFCSAVTFAQTHISPFIMEAQRLSNQNKYDEAITEINKAIEIQPQDAGLFLRRASYFTSVKNKEAAFKDVQTALTLKLTDKQKLEWAASLLLSNGYYEECKKVLDSLIPLDEANYLAYRIRLQNKFYLNDYKGTIEDIIKVTELNPQAAWSYADTLLKSLSNLKNDKNILNYYNRLFDFYQSQTKNVILYPPKFNTGEPISADYAKSISRDMNTISREILFHGANLFDEKRQTRNAQKLLNKLTKVEPKWRGYEYRGRFYSEKRKYKEAIKEITKELNFADTSYLKSSILFKRGNYYYFTKQYNKAIADYEGAKSLNLRIEKQANEKIALSRQKMRENGNQPK